MTPSDDIDMTSFPDTVLAVGTEGIGVSALCGILLFRGHTVWGSDRSPGPISRDLVRQGMRSVDTPADLPRDPVSLVIRSAAVPDTDPFVRHFLERKVPVIKYGEALGRLSRQFTGIAVAGTHGKTTTTALLAHVLTAAGLDPTVVCGGLMKPRGRNYRCGRSEWLVFESCEYDRTFLRHFPAHAIVTNIEADHLDIYRDIGEIEAAFHDFCARIPGRLVFGGDGGQAARVCDDTPGYQSYGLSDGNRFTVQPLSTGNGVQSFRRRDTVTNDITEWTVPLPGDHAALNAAAVSLMAEEAGVPAQEIRKGLASFPGVSRRFDILARTDDLIILDDYAHHPTEIETTIAGIRSFFPDRYLLVIFQAHQYSRTRLLLNRFLTCFSGADEVILTDIYEQRDSIADKEAIDGERFAALLTQHHRNARYVPFPELIRARPPLERAPAVLATFGAGNVDQAARAYASERV